MADQNNRDARVETLLRAVDELDRERPPRTTPKPFQQVIQELEEMAKLAEKLPRAPRGGEDC